MLAFFVLVLSDAFAQKNRYAVFFTDKNDNPFSVDAPAEFLSARAIARRERMGIPVVKEDLPVNPHYVDSLRELEVEVHYTSRWFNLALVEATETEAILLNDISIVETVELVAPGEKLNSGRKKDILKINTKTAEQNEYHNIIQMHEKGLTGKGVWIAIMDGGFAGVQNINAFQHIFNDNRMVITKNIVENDENVYQFSDHGTKVLSLIAGFETDVFIGGAYDAHIGLFVTEEVNTEYRVEEYNWLFAAEMADSAGFDIINTSLGYNTFDDPTMDYTYEDMDGVTAIITLASNKATARGILTVTSAGNSGNDSWRFITAPADAIGNLSVGAVDMNGNKASFSSFGPTYDGRIKPEVAALGVGVTVINSSGNIVTSNGTSFSAPIITGIMGGIYEEFPDASLAALRALAIDWSSQTENPDFRLGYGVLKYGGAEEVVGVNDIFTITHAYPNPAKKILYIDPALQPEEIKAYDMAGKSYLLENSNNAISISTLPDGLYLLKIVSNKKLFITKFVKE